VGESCPCGRGEEKQPESEGSSVNDTFVMKLANGESLIDLSDKPIIDAWPRTWRINDSGYVVSLKRTLAENSTVRLHRLLLGFPESPIDHINGIKTDNRRSNLRLCTDSQNLANRGCIPHGCKYKGVTVHKKKYGAQIWCGGVRYWLGVFDTEDDAGRAYDLKAIELFGPFARTNFPREQYALAASD
jgi:hypothetical protein